MPTWSSSARSTRRSRRRGRASPTWTRSLWGAGRARLPVCALASRRRRAWRGARTCRSTASRRSTRPRGRRGAPACAGSSAWRRTRCAARCTPRSIRWTMRAHTGSSTGSVWSRLRRRWRSGPHGTMPTGCSSRVMASSGTVGCLTRRGSRAGWGGAVASDRLLPGPRCLCTPSCPSIVGRRRLRTPGTASRRSLVGHGAEAYTLLVRADLRHLGRARGKGGRQKGRRAIGCRAGGVAAVSG